MSNELPVKAAGSDSNPTSASLPTSEPPARFVTLLQAAGHAASRAARRLFGGGTLEAMSALGSLLYLGFLFLPAFLGVPNTIWLVPTLVSIVLFLPVYTFAWRRRGTQRLSAGLLVAVLGMALQPNNPSAHTYIIFAVAILATVPPWQRGIGASLLVLTGYSAWVVYLDEPRSGIALGVAWLVSIAVALFNGLAAANARKEASLKLSQEEVRQLARVAERERIGRDLHDLLGHTLSVIVLKAELAVRLSERDPVAAAKEMAEVERIARESLGQVRRAVVGIRAAGLAAEVAQGRLALESAGIALHCDSVWPKTDPASETVFALAVREAVTNVLRHARATDVWIELAVDEQRWALSVRDNGKGGPIQPGFGLNGMRERAEAMGGKLLLESSKDGWSLHLRLPKPPPNPETDAASPMWRRLAH